MQRRDYISLGQNSGSEHRVSTEKSVHMCVHLHARVWIRVNVYACMHRHIWAFCKILRRENKEFGEQDEEL